MNVNGDVLVTSADGSVGSSTVRAMRETSYGVHDSSSLAEDTYSQTALPALGVANDAEPTLIPPDSPPSMRRGEISFRRLAES